MKSVLRFLPVMLLLTGFFTSANAQTFKWADAQPFTYSLNPQMVRYSVATDTAGNVIQAGLLTYKSNTTPGMSGDVLLRKYDRNGALIFSHTLTGNAVVRHILSCPNGDFILAGAYRDSVRFGPGHSLAGTSTSQYFLARYNHAGQVLWQRNLSATISGFRELTAITQDSVGMLYMGFTALTLHSFIKKFDAAGNEVLHIQQDNVGVLSSLAIDQKGNILVSGSCVKTGAMFGGQSVTSGSTYNMYLARYSPSGSSHWVKIVQDITCIQTEIKAGPNSSVYMAGVLNGSFAFGSLTSQGRTWIYDFFLTKADSNGTFLWLKEVPQTMTGDADIGYSNYLDVDAAGNAYITGFMRNNIDWGNGIQNNGYGAADFMVQQYDAAGNLKWSKNGGGTNLDEGHSLVVNKFGEVYMAGITRASIELDTINVSLVSGGSNIYTVLAKISAPATITGLTTGKVASHQLQLYPNPASAEATLLLPETGHTPVQISLINGTGQLVQTFTAQPTQALKLNLKHLPKGLYLVKTQQGTAVYHNRLVLE